MRKYETSSPDELIRWWSSHEPETSWSGRSVQCHQHSFSKIQWQGRRKSGCGVVEDRYLLPYLFLLFKTLLNLSFPMFSKRLKTHLFVQAFSQLPSPIKITNIECGGLGSFTANWQKFLLVLLSKLKYFRSSRGVCFSNQWMAFHFTWKFASNPDTWHK